MSSVVISGDTSGTVTLQAPAVAGSTVITLPSTSMTISSVPAGQLITFAGSTPPTGYLTCPTAATNISRTTYADLFAAIGTTWGAGDGSTTFGIPWFAAGYAMTQANSNVATATVGEVIAHTHTYTLRTGGTSMFSTAVGTGTGSAATNTSSTGGAANLAASTAVLFCVKF